MKIKDGKVTITSKIAYIAGFFDGEGCVRIKESNQGGNSYYVIAHITNTNKAILEQIKDLFGGTIRTQERGVNKTVYSWNISSSEAVDFLKTLSPFLQEKQAQADVAIRFHNIKDTLTLEQKRKFVNTITGLKKQSMESPNIYENSDLLSK